MKRESYPSFSSGSLWSLPYWRILCFTICGLELALIERLQVVFIIAEDWQAILDSADRQSRKPSVIASLTKCLPRNFSIEPICAWKNQCMT
ncbi:MAG: hypothetical protein WCS42_18275 [Verrucomicrobiota bacterium]